MSATSSQWSTLDTPVAKTLCQKSVIFSSRGRFVLIMRYTQEVGPGLLSVPGFHVQGWYLSSSNWSTASKVSGWSNSSTVSL